MRGHRYSTVAAITTDGVMTHRTVEGSFDAEMFLDFIMRQVVRLIGGVVMQWCGDAVVWWV